MNFLIIFFATFAAAIFSGFFGLGAGIIGIFALSFFFPLPHAVALSSVFCSFIILSKIYFFWNSIDWKITAIFSAAALPASILGAFFFTKIDAEILKKILAAAIFSVLIFRFLPRVKNLKLNFSAIFCGAAIFGFLSGISGVGNFFKILILQQLKLKKEIFIATSASVSILQNLTKIGIFFNYKILQKSDFYFWPIFAVAAICGIRIGKFLLQKVSQKNFDRAISAILFFIAAKFFFF